MDFYNFLANTTGTYAASAEPKSTVYQDIPFKVDQAWVLGRKFSLLHDLDDVRTLIRSKIWFSYRRNFPPIGGTGPVTDKHWGCMLRCGQMVMAEAIINRHFGRGWTWNSEGLDPAYLKIIRMFQDKKNSPYSIHQIAQMGVSEGKSIGQWFGPNTVAQVLRKLAVYDEWSGIIVHIALDNAVIVEDIKTICKCPQTPPASKLLHTNHSYRFSCLPPQGTSEKLRWKPMLLFIPLRLGLSTLNPIYTRSLKKTFMIKQTLGIIGGRPSHALWFIGYVGNEFIVLDPHTTQPTVDLDCENPDDSTFHIPYGGSKRIAISDIDPSISLCFYFESEEDFDQWCTVYKNLIASEKQPLFEIAAKRPTHWPPLELAELAPDMNKSVCSLDYDILEDDSDDEFEPIYHPSK